MTKRKRIVFIIIVIVFIIAAVLIYLNRDFLLGLFKKNPPAAVVTEQPTSGEETNLPPGEFTSIAKTTPEVLSPEEIERKKVAQLSGSFAEKFGSYSSQNDFQNLKELEVFMTAKMWALTENNLMAPSENSEIYYGQTTKALATKEVKYSSASAEFLVQCQRQESGENLAGPRVYYQDIKIQLIKVGDEWLVDSAVWQ